MIENFSDLDGANIIQLIEEMSSAVNSPDTADIDLLRDVAAQYSELCDAANRRLIQCHDLLKKGLRDEAIQACERPPHILEIVELLDFPEHDIWCELLRNWQMVQPPTLKIDLAADLNEAYAEVESLGNLLAKHRLLALGHANLSARIQVLRRIRERDPGSPAWEKDLVDYERSRLKEIENEIGTASKNEDVSLVNALSKELSTNQWVVAPNAELLSRCEEAASTLNRKHAREQLEYAERRLNEAYSAFDVQMAETAAKAWMANIKTAQLSAEDPLLERVEPALQWLAEQHFQQNEEEEYDAACAQLQHLLDEEASVSDLERVYHEVARMDRGIPEMLEHRYLQRVSAGQLASRRRFYIAMAATIGAVAVCIAVVSTVLWKKQQATKLENTSVALRDLLDAGNLSGAAQTYEQIHSRDASLATHPEIMALKGQLDAAVEAEDQRTTSFAAAIERVKSRGFDAPDQESLRKSKQLARTEAERTEVLNLESAIESRAAEKQQEMDEAFLAGVSPLREAIERLSGGDSMSDESREQLLKKTRGQLDGLLATHPKTSSAVRGQADVILTRLQAIQQDLDTRRRQKAALTALIVNVRKTEDYKRAAQNYINAHRDAPMADDLKKVIEEAPLWESVEAWTQFLNRPEFHDLRQIDALKASALIADGDKLLSTNGKVVLSEEYTQRLPLLKAIAARVDAENKPVQSSLGQLQRDTLISNIYMLGLADGKRYYLEAKAELKEEDALGRASIEYINGLDFTTKKSSVPVQDVVYNDIAPQSKVIGQIVRELAQVKPADWENKILRSIDTIRKDEHLDPILEYLLLKRVLAIACLGSLPLKELLGEYCDELQAAPIDVSVNWLDPTDDDAKAMRTRIRTVLGRCPSLDKLEPLVQEKIESLCGPPPAPLTRTGLMARQDGGGWVYLGQNDAPESGTMFVVTKGLADTNSLNVEEVGTITTGAVTWREPFDNRYLGGRPIFLRASSKPRK